jgi:glycosyltransferase involved in cell wall biosynthesis
MESPPKKLKVLLSAYACEPNRGSEPGVGWEWANRMAGFHDVTVLTRANNREIIESSLGSEKQPGQPDFIYFDLPPWCVKLKKRGMCPVFLYYLFWQWATSRRIGKQPATYDIIHHVTFNGFRFPGAWWSTSTPVVLGPLGGGSVTAPQFRRCFGWRWPMERLREFSVRFWRWNPWTVASLKNAAAVLVVGRSLRDEFATLGIKPEMMLETAVPLRLEDDLKEEMKAEERRNFLMAGNLEPWKGCHIAIEAFAHVVRSGVEPGRLLVVGGGSQEAELRELAERSGIGDLVDFLGRQSRQEVWDLMSSVRGLLFPSIRETSGNVVLEAMGLKCPVICFNHQGVGMITDDNCAIRITPGAWEACVMGFGDAVQRLSGDTDLVSTLGEAGRNRVMTEFTWHAKITAMLKIYRRTAQTEPCATK